jgi:hypothetical protein
MKKEIKKILSAMKVKEDREDAEQLAYDIYKLAPDDIKILIDTGKEFIGKPADEKNRNFLRAIIFTLIIFYKKTGLASKTHSIMKMQSIC